MPSSYVVTISKWSCLLPRLNLLSHITQACWLFQHRTPNLRAVPLTMKDLVNNSNDNIQQIYGPFYVPGNFINSNIDWLIFPISLWDRCYSYPYIEIIKEKYREVKWFSKVTQEVSERERISNQSVKLLCLCSRQLCLLVFLSHSTTVLLPSNLSLWAKYDLSEGRMLLT